MRECVFLPHSLPHFVLILAWLSICFCWSAAHSPVSFVYVCVHVCVWNPCSCTRLYFTCLYDTGSLHYTVAAATASLSYTVASAAPYATCVACAFKPLCVVPGSQSIFPGPCFYFTLGGLCVCSCFPWTFSSVGISDRFPEMLVNATLFRTSMAVSNVTQVSSPACLTWVSLLFSCHWSIREVCLPRWASWVFLQARTAAGTLFHH